MLLSDRYRSVSCDRSRSPHRFRREMPYRKREYGQMRSRRKREQSLIDPTKSHHYEQRKTIVPGHREIFESPHVGHRVRARDPDAPVDILARETQQPPRSDFQTRITELSGFYGTPARIPARLQCVHGSALFGKIPVERIPDQQIRTTGGSERSVRRLMLR